MATGFLARLRPAAPWRIGPDSGARDRVDPVFHSDALYAAVSGALVRLGLLEDWFADTALRANGPAVRFSSCYPFLHDTLYIAPPRSHWPPPPSAKLRYKAARFIPVKLVEALLSDQAIEEDRWKIDGPSECLLPSGAPHGPFRVSLRSNAAVDRLHHGNSVTHATACLEFAPGGGLWLAADFADDAARARWEEPVKAALRLLADSGFGGERSRGWGRAEMPEFTPGDLPALIASSPDLPAGGETAYWLLSLFSPSPDDAVDWKRGSYHTVIRGGRVESASGWGGEKRASRLVGEGSVLMSASQPVGAAPDVAPPGFHHPVYRAGFALSIPIPWRVAQ